MHNGGQLLVVSGPSGVGKDAVLKVFQELCPSFCSSVSATTRAIRPGEVDGKDYIFLTREQFSGMIEKGELLEFTQYNQNFYGSPSAFIQQQLTCGDVVMNVEVEGAGNVKKAIPQAILVFMAPPSMAELWRRLVGRGTEDEATCRRRFDRAYEELACVSQYDYVVVNDDVEQAAQDLISICRTQRCTYNRREAFCNLLMMEEVK